MLFERFKHSEKDVRTGDGLRPIRGTRELFIPFFFSLRGRESGDRRIHGHRRPRVRRGSCIKSLPSRELLYGKNDFVENEKEPKFFSK